MLPLGSMLPRKKEGGWVLTASKLGCWPTATNLSFSQDHRHGNVPSAGSMGRVPPSSRAGSPLSIKGTECVLSSRTGSETGGQAAAENRELR